MSCRESFGLIGRRDRVLSHDNLPLLKYLLGIESVLFLDGSSIELDQVWQMTNTKWFQYSLQICKDWIIRDENSLHV
ncbi:hypothetical protein D3C80_2054110 [compost metagenome]